MTLGSRTRVLLTALVAHLAGACGVFGGVQVEALDASAQKPSNVALYVGVTDGGEPVTDLEAKHFRIFENGQELASNMTQRTLLSRAAVTDARVLLLIDVSGNPKPAELVNLTEAVEAFVRKVSVEVPVSVRAFDGGPSLKTVGDFARGSTNPSTPAIARLANKDASRDLNGAVVAGFAELDKSLSGSHKPVRLGTVVVFARGPDLAGRVDDGKLADALDASHYDVIGVGIGEDVPFLNFARGGVIHSQRANTLPIAFEEAGSRVAATHAKYYLIAYCSPARAGRRNVRIEVVHEDKEGNEHVGSVDHDFDATGFGPGCRPETTPRFEHKDEAHTSSASPQVIKAPATDPDETVPPPSSGDYAK